MGNKFDELLTQVGTGWWNMIYFITTCYWYLLIPPQVLSGVYLTPLVNHTCLPPPLDDPVEISSDSCSYLVNNSFSGEVEEFPCNEWEYDTSVYINTLTKEFNLVCERGYLRATYQSIYMSATIFSSMVGGYIADRYGRKFVVLVTQLIYAVLGFSISFANNFSLILALRFIMGCVGLPTIYILSLEVCEVKYRSVVGILTGLPWAIGTMAWGGVASQVRDWRWLQLYVTLPFVLIIPLLFLMDESPRWLIVRGQCDRAREILQKAARWNKTQLPSEEALKKLMLDIKEELVEPEKPVLKEKQNRRWTFLKTPALCRTRPMRIITFIFSLNLFISALVFCGLSLSGANYSADPFIYIVLGGLMEVPGYSLTAPLINRVGRKWPTIWGYVLSGIAILLLVFIPDNIQWLVMTLAMLGKLCNSGAFMIIFVYMSEVLPTEVRLQGVGATIMTCQLGATIAPYITDFVGPLVPWAPSVIFGVSSLVAGVAMLPLHETLDAPMPDTINDVPNISLKPRLSRRKRDVVVDEEEKLNKQPA
ncbi:organic cation transporter protein-like isoform X1 [Penaeus chinensis]|uniref:organic cation transporter protein-like isoform X1 n=1 Tax=Penaeus chinensis TaxID=139456 RepID=UPI001FB59690|nr:organic cation transporter protein-like isoform X1 [Penaeus chinensis]XP_047493110.1 organic cation transporter protein-like isoform X1 [Penaeus chinensis]XP_047493112.1 organic cation transporter protein-like isoform X1 [Penaeus chinensis]XP_047493113.1 organic cation transporter protein-like isoform X1 [Penaeus chinensis]